MLKPKLWILIALATTVALAQTTTTRTSHLPPFGLGSTETARVNLTNIATAASGGTAPSCTGNVAFVSATGSTIGTATTFTIASGVTSSVSLAFSSAGLSGSRGEIRATITLTRTSGVPCSLLFSLETFDTSSGATHSYFAGSDGFEGHR
jgi:hypothetical protein